MASIKSCNTQCELQLARLLRESKIHYRRRTKHLPGKPDFILLAASVAVFVDGDFWHGRDFVSWKKRLSSYWLQKITRNCQRDKNVGRELRARGFRVVRIWESVLQKKPEQAKAKILRTLSKFS